MSLFDKHGKVDAISANQIYQQAASQVTGRATPQIPPSMMQPGVPVIGQEKLDFSKVVALTHQQCLDLRKTVDYYLQNGVHPNATIGMDFASYACLVKTMETLGAFEEKEIEEAAQEE